MSEATERAFHAAYDAMLARWPFAPEARDVATRSGRTRVQVWGEREAPPLVLLHGFKVTSTMWGPQAAALGATRRVYAADVLGDYGRSVAARAPQTIDDLVEWLGELLDGLGLGRVDLGGMSRGGWISAHYARRFPERVRRLVLLAPGATMLPIGPAFILRGIPMLLWRRRAHVDWYMRWAGVPPVADRARYDAIMDGIVDVMHTGHRHYGLAREAYPAVIDDEALRAIQAPTLLLYGDHEKMYDPNRALARARALVPQLEGMLIANASHDLTFAQPDRVNEEVVRFLDG